MRGRMKEKTPAEKEYHHRVKRIQTVMRVLRERANLSQTELADMLGRQQPEVSMWEWGKEPMVEPMRLMVVGVLRSYLHNEYPRLTQYNLLRPWDEVILEWSGDAN